MKNVNLHTQFGVINPTFFIGRSGREILIYNTIIQLDSILRDLIVEYEDNLKELDLNNESFVMHIYEGVYPRITIDINNRRFEGVVSLHEIDSGYDIYV